MKIKDNFVLKKVMDDYIVVPVGNELVDFDSMITLNESGAFLWEQMLKETTVDEILAKMLKEYDIDKETALADINEFAQKLKTVGVLDNE